jgi:hypothetical protein
VDTFNLKAGFGDGFLEGEGEEHGAQGVSLLDSASALEMPAA